MSSLPITICLNMIVKNESRIITRLLKSVLPIIDTYVICDTGSTDNTPEIITDFLTAHNIQGKMIHEPFKNFGYNRTFAFNKAKGTATYALLLDADMVLTIDADFNKNGLSADSYIILQRGGVLSYFNTRLIKLDVNARCVGPTHEYYDLPPGSVISKCTTLSINDIGDGGSKGDKYVRDIRLLKAGIEEEPTNARYYFYLANSYFNSGRHIESIPYYKKRIELGGWYEEVFYSHLNLGHAYMKADQPENAIYTWLEGYNRHSSRSETIYEITKYYRERGNNKLGLMFCLLGKNILYPQNDCLFIHNNVYEYEFDYELSILGYYTNYMDLHKIACKLLNNPALASRRDNIISNYKYYAYNLSKKIKMQKVEYTEFVEPRNINIFEYDYLMKGSNPSLFIYNNKKYLIIRMINYTLLKSGCYDLAPDGKIASYSIICELDEQSYKIKRICSTIINPNENPTNRYLGIEDIRVFVYPIDMSNSNDNTSSMGLSMGTMQNPITGKLCIGFTKFDLSSLNLDVNEDNDESNGDYGSVIKYIKYTSVNTIWNKECEKNWVVFDENNIIYSWYPLVIGRIEENVQEGSGLLFRAYRTKTMPEYFKNVRGSTNGFKFGNEVWFICHIVEYCQPREYYHFFVVMDTQTMNVLKWSYLFKFEGEKIEYCMGLIVEEEKIIVSYSKWDSTPTLAVYNKKMIEKELFD